MNVQIKKPNKLMKNDELDLNEQQQITKIPIYIF